MYQLQTIVVQQPMEEVPRWEVEPRSKKEAKTTCSLTSSLANCSPAAALHSTSAFG
jgi:hypothetical protein